MRDASSRSPAPVTSGATITPTDRPDHGPVSPRPDLEPGTSVLPLVFAQRVVDAGLAEFTAGWPVADWQVIRWAQPGPTPAEQALALAEACNDAADAELVAEAWQTRAYAIDIDAGDDDDEQQPASPFEDVVNGQVVRATAPAEERVVDLMAALEASVTEAKAARKAREVPTDG